MAERLTKEDIQALVDVQKAVAEIEKRYEGICGISSDGVHLLHDNFIATFPEYRVIPVTSAYFRFYYKAWVDGVEFFTCAGYYEEDTDDEEETDTTDDL